MTVSAYEHCSVLKLPQASSVRLTELKFFSCEPLPQANPMWRRPPLQNKEVITTCPDCKQEFGLLLWKYNCRACGFWFCDACSQGRRTIPKFDYFEPQRVCNLCFVAISGTQTYDRSHNLVENEEQDTLSQLPTTTLKGYGASRGLDLSTCTEKSEMARLYAHCFSFSPSV